MEIQLQELIDKIKKDGLDSAAEEAAKLKAHAENEAKSIIDGAKKEADAIRTQAEADRKRDEAAGIAAVGQAGRNAVLAFKAEIQGLLDRIVEKETAKALDDSVLKAVLPDLLKNYAKGSAVQVVLNETQAKTLEDFFKTKLAGELKAGVELKSDRNLAAGFRIANKDGSAYYDFSAEAVAELFSAYLNPKLAETLKEAVK
jgi:V/A-type H+-transporting ATPase subunit E